MTQALIYKLESRAFDLLEQLESQVITPTAFNELRSIINILSERRFTPVPPEVVYFQFKSSEETQGKDTSHANTD